MFPLLAVGHLAVELVRLYFDVGGHLVYGHSEVLLDLWQILGGKEN